MNVLIIGSGAREHAMAVALHRSNPQPQIFCCGTALNPGIQQMSLRYWVGDITHCNEIVNLAKDWQIGLAIIGPEAPLAAGLADALWHVAIPTIGPRQQLAQIETSKGFARDLLQKYQVPGLPRYQRFLMPAGIEQFLTELGDDNYVVKADGLMGGKGVKVAGEHLHSFQEALSFCNEVFQQGQAVVVEEKLIGQEFSCMAFCDGEHLVHMPLVQDHKRAFVDDKGPNTGGMGSYSNADHSLPFLQTKDVEDACFINQAVIRALHEEIKEKYIGILYGGFIATKKGVQVIEFNARFGDPEALNVLTLLHSDFTKLCQAMVTGALTPAHARFLSQATVCKYAVPNGYPDEPLKEAVIDISAVKNKANLYLAAVNMQNGKIYATGSRTAAYVGVADTISAAEEIAEREVRAIDGSLFHREDIGTDRLVQQRIDHMRELRGR